MTSERDRRLDKLAETISVSAMMRVKLAVAWERVDTKKEMDKASRYGKRYEGEFDRALAALLKAAKETE